MITNWYSFSPIEWQFLELKIFFTKWYQISRCASSFHHLKIHIHQMTDFTKWIFTKWFHQGAFTLINLLCFRAGNAFERDSTFSGFIHSEIFRHSQYGFHRRNIAWNFILAELSFCILKYSVLREKLCPFAQRYKDTNSYLDSIGSKIKKDIIFPATPSRSKRLWIWPILMNIAESRTA